jgi:hypothetical protein
LIPEYTKEDIKKISILGDKACFHTMFTLTLDFSNGPEALKTNIDQKLKIIEEQKKNITANFKGWSCISIQEEERNLTGIKKALFCDSNELPLLLDMPFFSEIVKWRIDHGK